MPQSLNLFNFKLTFAAWHCVQADRMRGALATHLENPCSVLVVTLF